MPLRFVPCGPAIERDGRMVTPLATITTCEVCGASAPFGEGVNLRRAIAERKAELAGKWWCRKHWKGRP